MDFWHAGAGHFAHDANRHTAKFYRLINEAPAALMAARSCCWRFSSLFRVAGKLRCLLKRRPVNLLWAATMSDSSTQNRLIAGRYAGALFDLASAAKAQDAVQADLAALAKWAQENRDMQTLFTSPLISRADAGNAMGAILEKAKANAVTAKFFVTLAANRRLDLVALIAERFDELLEQSRGEMTARLETASAADAAVQGHVASALSKATGKKVKLRLHENPSILGGLVVRFGGKRLDLSVAGRLDRLSQALRIKA